jgi:hypothetical protein
MSLSGSGSFICRRWTKAICQQVHEGGEETSTENENKINTQGNGCPSYSLALVLLIYCQRRYRWQIPWHLIQVRLLWQWLPCTKWLLVFQETTLGFTSSPPYNMDTGISIPWWENWSSHRLPYFPIVSLLVNSRTGTQIQVCRVAGPF